MNDYYVYEHLLDGNVFYVGHGHNYRAWAVKSRSERYKKYVQGRYDEIEVVIVYNNLTKEQALQYEEQHQIQRQSEGHNIIGMLGTHSWNEGLSLSNEHKQKISDATRKAMNTPEMKAKMSEIRKGKRPSDAHKAAISNTLKGITRSEETRKKISEAKKLYYAQKRMESKHIQSMM